jgi:polyether ionophore transport system permease protein
MLVVGAAVGSIGTGAADLINSSEGVKNVLVTVGGNITDAFFASIFLLLALMATGFTISSSLRLHGEEVAGHAELLLSTPLARLRWAAGHLLIAMAGSVVVLAAAGLGAGVAYRACPGRSAASLTAAPVLALTALTARVPPARRDLTGAAARRTVPP